MIVKALAGLICVALAGLVSGRACAAEAQIEPLARLRATAVGALRAELGASADSRVMLAAGALDSRLRMPACTQALSALAHGPRGSEARVLVRVQCAAPVWTVNVPVGISRKAEVLVLKRAIARGEYVQPTDVDVASRVVPGLASPFLAQVGELAGRPARRMLPAGSVVTAEALSPALLIYRGQTVTLISSVAGIEVRASGRALANAGVNQRVRVQNANSLKILEGVADIQGVVRVDP